jgi:hypothetical protein
VGAKGYKITKNFSPRVTFEKDARQKGNKQNNLTKSLTIKKLKLWEENGFYILQR